MLVAIWSQVGHKVVTIKDNTFELSSNWLDDMNAINKIIKYLNLTTYKAHM